MNPTQEQLMAMSIVDGITSSIDEAFARAELPAELRLSILASAALHVITKLPEGEQLPAYLAFAKGVFGAMVAVKESPQEDDETRSSIVLQKIEPEEEDTIPEPTCRSRH